MIERSSSVSQADTLRIDNLSIQNVEIEEDDQKKIVQRVKVLFGGDFDKSKARIHAWAFKFFPYDL